MTTRISTYSQSLLTTTSLLQAEVERNEKAQQAANGGKISEYFREFGAETERALTLQSSLISLGAYQKNIDTAESRLRMLGATLNNIIDLNISIRSNLSRAMSSDEIAREQCILGANQELAHLEGLLNQTFEGVFIFGNGTTELPVDTSSLPIPDITDGPNYTYSRAGTRAPSIQVAANEDPIVYYAGAEESGFETMIRGLMLIKSASMTDDARLDKADELLKESQGLLLKLQASFARAEARLEMTKTMHNTFKDSIDEAYREIGSLNMVEIIEAVNNAETQFHLSVGITKTITDISSLERYLQ